MTSLEEYFAIDERVDGAERDGIWARWEFGSRLKEERVWNEQFRRYQLPDGRLDELSARLEKSRSELQYRVQFADRFPTKEQVSNALDTYGSWHEIVNRALGREKAPPADTPELPDGAFSTIVADPPWEVTAGAHEWGGSAQSQALEYPTMTVEAISDLQVESRAAEDAHLYLWTINRYVEDAYDIARSWGFKPSTLLVWCKPRHGLGLGGSYVLTSEYVLFATRGSLPTLGRVDTSWFEWPRRRHSQKPHEFRAVVESVSPGPYLELFAREQAEGWTVWGNEAAAMAA